MSLRKEGSKLVQYVHLPVQVFFALTMAALAISQSSSFAPDSSKAKVATASIFAILDRKSKIDPSDESGQILENVKGEIELQHISFKYPTRPDIQIFRDLSLTIHSGKVIKFFLFFFLKEKKKPYHTNYQILFFSTRVKF